MKYILPFILLLLNAISVNACASETGYSNGQLYFPEAKIGGPLPNFLASYVLTKRGAPLKSADLLTLYDKLQTNLFGGVPVDGKLIVELNHVRFEPHWASTLIAENFKEIKIPIRDIRSVKVIPRMLSDRDVGIETQTGVFRFNVFHDITNIFGLNEDDLVKLIAANIMITQTKDAEAAKLPKTVPNSGQKN